MQGREGPLLALVLGAWQEGRVLVVVGVHPLGSARCWLLLRMTQPQKRALVASAPRRQQFVAALCVACV